MNTQAMAWILPQTGRRDSRPHHRLCRWPAPGVGPGVGRVLLGGRRVPIVGRICMDQTLVDVTAIPEVRAGDPVTLLGESGGSAISACDMAEQAGTIANEILSRLGSRLERWPVGQTEPARSLRWPWPGRRLEPGRHRAEKKTPSEQVQKEIFSGESGQLVELEGHAALFRAALFL